MYSAIGPAPCVFPHIPILSLTVCPVSVFSEDKCEQLRLLAYIRTNPLARLGLRSDDVCETCSVLTSCVLVYSAGTGLKLSRSSGLIVKIVYVGVSVHMKSPSVPFPAGSPIFGWPQSCCNALLLSTLMSECRLAESTRLWQVQKLPISLSAFRKLFKC